MARKRNSNSSQPQQSLFDESPNSETIERAITGSSDTPTPAIIICPKCGAVAAKSVKGGEFQGVYYCQGACSYGDNFYFKPEVK
jgi:hypothetical protein